MALYHLHIDAMSIPSELHRHVQEQLGFRETNFAIVAQPYEHFEPAAHYTLKTCDLAHLRASFTAVRTLLGRSDFVGYVEAEYIASDVDLADRPEGKVPGPSIPFTTTRACLASATFRGSEIHVAMQTGDPAAPICEAMRAMGYFTAFMNKIDGRFSIFTLQGSKRKIRDLLRPTADFLQAQGGYTRCSIKEERVIDWWTSHPDVSLPPVVGDIRWRSDATTARADTHGLAVRHARRG